MRQALIWIEINGGSPIDWQLCCEALSRILVELFDSMALVWRRTIAQKEDRDVAVRQLSHFLEQEWAGHEFDPFVLDAVQQLGIEGLDEVKYREGQLANWRALVSLFKDRKSASAAIRIAILNELRGQFSRQ